MLEQSVRESGDQAGAQSNLAIVYAGLGQRDAALKAAQRATELIPVSKDALDGTFYLARLTKIEAQVGEIESALVPHQTIADRTSRLRGIRGIAAHRSDMGSRCARIRASRS